MRISVPAATGRPRLTDQENTYDTLGRRIDRFEDAARSDPGNSRRPDGGHRAGAERSTHVRRIAHADPGRGGSAGGRRREPGRPYRHGAPQRPAEHRDVPPVSYTHLTLPTSDL